MRHSLRLACLSGLFLALAGCSSTTADLGGSVPDAGSARDAMQRAPDAGFGDQSFVMICLSQLAPDISKALLWKVDLTYTPAGGGGTLTYTSRSLPAGATDISTTLDPTLPASGVLSAAIDADGRGTLDLGSVTIPAGANGLTGGAMPLDMATLALRVASPTQICADLGGKITAPAPLTLNPSQNPCIVLPTDGARHWATVTTSDVHCP